MTRYINRDVTARAEGGGEATNAVSFGGYVVASGVNEECWRTPMVAAKS